MGVRRKVNGVFTLKSENPTNTITTARRMVTNKAHNFLIAPNMFTAL